MARGKLTVFEVGALKAPGLHHVGDGLYLRITDAGSRSWVFRYQRGGIPRSMGLGTAAQAKREDGGISLADARAKAVAARQALHSGIDPIDAARQKTLAEATEKGRAVTFKEAAEVYVAAHKDEWRNAKHGAQWLATLEAYAFPHFGNVSVGGVDRAMVLKALEPIWKTKNETARRVRGRIENILDAATARGQRSGENPARWRLLKHLVAKHSKVKAVRHHPALPYSQIAGFMTDLRKQEGTAAQCLEFTVLTAARTSEAVGARWDEIDLKGALWTVPASRIKAGRVHRVPLSAPALAILDAQAMVRENEFVFPGGRRKKPLSNMAMAALLKRMGRKDFVVHGLRSSFRDWAAEMTSFPREVAEMALAHAVGDAVERAYRRGDLLTRRAKMMQAWAAFALSPTSGKVVSIGSRRQA